MTAYYSFRCSLFWALCTMIFSLGNPGFLSLWGISNTRGSFGSDQVTHHLFTEANPQRQFPQHTISHQRHLSRNQTTMKITKRDPMTGTVNTLDLDITEEQMGRINAGIETIQQIVPHLSPDEREFLITGITPGSWDSIFPPEQEEELPLSQK